jgi:hypothetical protein
LFHRVLCACQWLRLQYLALTMHPAKEIPDLTMTMDTMIWAAETTSFI